MLLDPIYTKATKAELPDYDFHQFYASRYTNRKYVNVILLKID